MFSTLLLVVLAQIVPCTPGETSLVCSCKQGMASACVVLAGEDTDKASEVLDEVLEALDQAVQATKEGEGAKRKRKQLQTAAQSLSQALTSSEPPNCKGQEHHPISRPVARMLANHPTLKGLYKARDPRFVAHAQDEQSHCGYQDWHRKVDMEVIDWLDEHPKATSNEFMDKLREIYNRPEMQERFPHGF